MLMVSHLQRRLRSERDGLKTYLNFEIHSSFNHFLGL